jgi:hypothetical protein
MGGGQMKLCAADFYVIHDTLHRSLAIANFGSRFGADVRELTMDKIMDILAQTELDVTPETGEGVQ